MKKIILHSGFYLLIKMIKIYNNLTNDDLIQGVKLSRQVVSLIECQKIHTLKLSTYQELIKALSRFEIAKDIYIDFKKGE